MKKLILLFSLLANIAYSQVDISGDTTTRSGRTDKYRVGIISNQLYIIPPTGGGNTVPTLNYNNLYQNAYNAGETGAQYHLITTSTLANNNGLNWDALHLIANVGTWDATSRQEIDLFIGTRTTFTYNWISRGTAQTGDGIVVYQNANNTFSVYLVLTGNFRAGTVAVDYSFQYKPLSLNLQGSKSSTTPSGTLVFDSRNQATYVPVSLGGGSGGSGGTWGSITGTITSQTDLVAFVSQKAKTLNAQTGTTYTLVSTDCDKIITFNNASAITVTIPNSTLTAGCLVHWKQKGVGQITFTAGSGVTLDLFQGYTKSGGQNATGTLVFETSSLVTVGGQVSN